MRNSLATRRPHVVIVGGGFGGLAAARGLAHSDVDVTLVDKRNHHLFQPLLYQVATAGLAATDIAAPIRKILSGQENVKVFLARVDRVDVEARQLALRDGATGEGGQTQLLHYDHLILAAGMTNSYFGHDNWEAHAPGLKSLDEALEIRRKVLLAYESAERATGEEQREWLRFVVIGGGATGVELAGALREIAQRTLTHDFRMFDPKTAEVILLEGGDRLLPGFPPDLSERVRADLVKLGVDVRLGARADQIDATGVLLARVDGKPAVKLHARTVLWAAGVKGVPLGATLGVPVDRQGRVFVEPDLSVPGHPEISVIGDLAAIRKNYANPEVTDYLPGVAQVAKQGGSHVAKSILRRIAGQDTLPFRYFDLGSMATVGRSHAVALIGKVKLTGFVAWMAWLFVHLMALVGFRNRLAVFSEWAWAYLTYQRSARILLERPVAPALHQPVAVADAVERSKPSDLSSPVHDTPPARDVISS